MLHDRNKYVVAYNRFNKQISRIILDRSKLKLLLLGFKIKS